MVQEKTASNSPSNNPDVEAEIQRVPLRLEYLDPRTLKPNPDNFRRHGGRQRQAFSDLLDLVGMLTGIVYNEGTGRIIDGHMRVQEFIERNEPTMPVVICNVTAEEEKVALAFWDRVQQLATVDRLLEVALANQLKIEQEVLLGLIVEAQAGVKSTEEADNLDADPDVPDDIYQVGLVPGEGFHYVVLLFRTELDWYSAIDHFKLEKQADAFRPKLLKLQVVVDGAQYLEMVRSSQ